MRYICKTFVYHVSVYIWEMKSRRTSSRQTEQQSVAKGKVEIATGNAKITHTQRGATMLTELCLQLQAEGWGGGGIGTLMWRGHLSKIGYKSMSVRGLER